MRGILFYIIIFFLLVLQINAQPPCGNPAPPPVDFCQAACVLCDLSQIDGYTGTSGSFTSDGPAVCGMSVENNQWFAFMAISSSVSLTINSTGCSSGDGIQAVLFSGTCNALSVVDCQVSGPSSSQTITGNGLTVGDVYYVSIDGWAGAVCGFTVTVNYGAGNISVGNAGPITGPTIMCANGEGTYTISPVAGASEYTWTIPPGATINGSPGPQTLPAGSGESVTITFGANAAGQICVTPKNACNVGVPSCLTILPKIIPLI